MCTRASTSGSLPVIRRWPLHIAQFINLFLFALVAGVFWGTWFSLSRSIASITPATFLEIGRTMIVNLGGPMSVLMPAALLSALPVLFALFRGDRLAAFYLALAGLLLFVIALVITLAVNVPIDYEINQWTVDTLPADWTATRDRWAVLSHAPHLRVAGRLGLRLRKRVGGTERYRGKVNERFVQIPERHLAGDAFAN